MCIVLRLTSQYRCIRHSMRTPAPHRHHPLPPLPNQPPLPLPPLLLCLRHHPLRYHFRNPSHLLPLRLPLVAMAARIQDRNTDSTLCLQRDAITWQSNLLPHVEETSEHVGGGYWRSRGRVDRGGGGRGRGGEGQAREQFRYAGRWACGGYEIECPFTFQG